jgi:hypothetical protein
MGRSGRFVSLAIVMILFSAACFAETHWNLQAVDEYGVGTHPSIASGYKVTVEGYILNRAEYMLDGTPNYNTIPWNLGGQWQIFIQGEGGDHAGTAIWIGQNYANMTGIGFGRYTNEQWLAEVDRLNNDPCSGHRFMPGDKIRVTGLVMFHNGKTNINEQHSTGPDNDITIELVELGKGLPEPEVITLSQVKDGSDNFIFDSTRQTGCEYYQARLVRINDVNFVDANLWAPNATMTIRDNTGRTFPVLLGIGSGISVGSNNLPTQFDIIAIFDQEDTSSPYTAGYRLWITNYDGNGQILTDGCDLYGVFAAGDINKDCIVNFEDFAIMAADWLTCSNSLLEECQ